jgi:hypothetical protein
MISATVSPSTIPLSGEAFEQGEPPRVEIGSRGGRLAAELLGGGVSRGAERLVGAGDPRLGLALDGLQQRPDAEVEHHRVSSGAGGDHHDVGGLEIPVDHAGAVRARERVEDLCHQALRLGGLEAPLLGEHAPEIFARYVFEDE